MCQEGGSCWGGALGTQPTPAPHPIPAPLGLNHGHGKGLTQTRRALGCTLHRGQCCCPILWENTHCHLVQGVLRAQQYEGWAKQKPTPYPSNGAPGMPHLRGVQSQVGLGPGQPDLVPDAVVDSPAHSRRVGNGSSLSLSTQAIL